MKRIPHRKHLGKGSKRVFKKLAQKTHKKNFKASPMRGGIRL